MDSTPPDIKITSELKNEDNVFTFECVEMAIFMFFEIVVSIISLIITISIILQINHKTMRDRQNFIDLYTQLLKN